MELKVRGKLLIGYILVAILVVVAGVIGIVMMERVTSSTDAIIEKDVPMKDASMEALISIETVISESRNYVNNSTGLEAIRSDISGSLSRFEKEITEITSNSSGETRALAEKASGEYANFNSATMELLAAHKEKAGYTFMHKGASYDIKSFFYFLGIELAGWLDTLSDASKYGVPFTGNLDITKSDFTIWHANFKTTDAALIKRLKSFDRLNKKIFGSAQKIEDASADKKASYFKRAISRHFNKGKKDISKILNYIAPIFDELEGRERAALTRMEQSSGEIRRTLEDLEVSVDRGLSLSRDSADSAKSFANIFLVITIIVSVIVAIVIAFISAARITRPLNEAVDAAHRLASGDLGVEVNVTTTDETGQLLGAIREMVLKLREVIGGVKSASDNVASSSYELSCNSEEMSTGVNEQADKANQVATAATEMSATIVEIAKSASAIASSADDTTKIANEGRDIVDQTVNEVKEIESTVAESARLITSLGGRSNEIGNIINVINDIADQTNLLALNAAIEAARAGEMGRGFAVVADEVRKLAERTTQATKEIGTMIEDMQKETGGAVTSMEESLKRVEKGAELSSQAGQSLNNIVTSVGELQSMVTQVASATEELSSASEQISSDIEGIASISSHCRTGSSEMSKASADLSELAVQLHKGVDHFKLEGSYGGVSDDALSVDTGATSRLELLEGSSDEQS